MTPERKKWWDSLPAEEKRARRDIKELRTQITWHKIGLNLSCGHETEMRKFALRMNKRIIKALRKQIAMCPQINHLSDVLTRQPQLKCPCCSHRFVRHAPYCLVCGQKLRWK